MLSITKAIEALASRLESYFDQHGYEWKTSEDLGEFLPSKPFVYPFCVPPSDLNAVQMPSKCPCVLLALEKWTKTSNKSVRLDVSINCVVVDAAETDKEKAYFDGVSGYTMGKGDEYAQNARNLYRAALLLGECVVDAVSSMSNTEENPLSVDVSTFEPPHALLPDYPYSTCVVPVVLNIVNNGARDSSFYDIL